MWGDRGLGRTDRTPRGALVMGGLIPHRRVPGVTSLSGTCYMGCDPAYRRPFQLCAHHGITIAEYHTLALCQENRVPREAYRA